MSELTKELNQVLQEEIKRLEGKKISLESAVYELEQTLVRKQQEHDKVIAQKEQRLEIEIQEKNNALNILAADLKKREEQCLVRENETAIIEKQAKILEAERVAFEEEKKDLTALRVSCAEEQRKAELLVEQYNQRLAELDKK